MASCAICTLTTTHGQSTVFPLLFLFVFIPAISFDGNQARHSLERTCSTRVGRQHPLAFLSPMYTRRTFYFYFYLIIPSRHSRTSYPPLASRARERQREHFCIMNFWEMLKSERASWLCLFFHIPAWRRRENIPKPPKKEE